jgi:hypothetical protein
VWRIYWCLGLCLAGLARGAWGDPMHPAADSRSTVFLGVWVFALVLHVVLMYRGPHPRATGADYVMLAGLLLVIVFEVFWPVSALHNSHAGNLAAPLAAASLGSTWVWLRRQRSPGEPAP